MESLPARPAYCKGAFAAPANGTFSAGDSRNLFNNPGFWQWNLALHKAFPLPIREGARLEFRAETYDFLKHPNWGGVNSNPVSSTFMMVTSKSGSRNLQFELKLAF